MFRNQSAIHSPRDQQRVPDDANPIPPVTSTTTRVGSGLPAWMLAPPHAVLLIGPAVVDHLLTPLGAPPSLPGKFSSRRVRRLGGGAPNMARAIRRLGLGVQLAALIGRDECSNQVTRMLNQELPGGWFPVPAYEETRESFLVRIAPGLSWLPTLRPPLDGPGALASLASPLAIHSVVVLAPLAADDHHVALAILQRVAEQGARSYLMLSKEQLADQRRAMELIRAASCVQLNATEFEQLFPGEGLQNGLDRLRAEGVRGVVVTEGERGVRGFVEGQTFSHSAFQVASDEDVGPGDEWAGTFVAALAAGRVSAEAARLACAAAAMRVASLPRRGGWEELDEFAARTPTVTAPQECPARRPSLVRRIRERLRAASHPVTYIGAGLLVVGILGHLLLG